MSGSVVMRPNSCVYVCVPAYVCLGVGPPLIDCAPVFSDSHPSLPCLRVSLGPFCCCFLCPPFLSVHLDSQVARLRGDPGKSRRKVGRGRGSCELQVRRGKETEEATGRGRGVLASILGVGWGERMLPAARTWKEATLATPSCCWSPSSCLAAARPGLGCEAHSNGALRRLDCSSQLGRGQRGGWGTAPRLPAPPPPSWALSRGFPHPEKVSWEEQGRVCGEQGRDRGGCSGEAADVGVGRRVRMGVAGEKVMGRVGTGTRTLEGPLAGEEEPVAGGA